MLTTELAKQAGQTYTDLVVFYESENDRPIIDTREYDLRIADDERAKVEQNHQQAKQGATDFTGSAPEHIKSILIRHNVRGKHNAMVGLMGRGLVDEDARELVVDDVFYNTTTNRYAAVYFYREAPTVMYWCNIYDILTWATPLVETENQSESQLSDFEKTRLENIERNKSFWQG